MTIARTRLRELEAEKLRLVATARGWLNSLPTWIRESLTSMDRINLAAGVQKLADALLDDLMDEEAEKLKEARDAGP